MKTVKEIVSSLLSLQLHCLNRMEICNALEIEINLMGDMELWNIALDIIGFPEDNTMEFDFNTLNGHTPDGKRTDYENMFCRDWLLDPFYNREEDHSINLTEYIDWLFNEYNKLCIGDKLTTEVSRIKRTQLN
ncbi:MAG: hypothetical protein LIP05_12625 [Tannerellaceae bacterium]|nr:hypothetical protein [Tannerellaceae bacterium]